MFKQTSTTIAALFLANACGASSLSGDEKTGAYGAPIPTVARIDQVGETASIYKINTTYPELQEWYRARLIEGHPLNDWKWCFHSSYEVSGAKSELYGYINQDTAKTMSVGLHKNAPSAGGTVGIALESNTLTQSRLDNCD